MAQLISSTVSFDVVMLAYFPVTITYLAYYVMSVYIFRLGKDWTVNCLIVLVAYSAFGFEALFHYFVLINFYSQASKLAMRIRPSVSTFSLELLSHYWLLLRITSTSFAEHWS